MKNHLDYHFSKTIAEWIGENCFAT